MAGYAAGLLEAADRLDTVAYVHAVLPLLEQHRPPTLDVTALAFMVYSVAVDGLTFDIQGLQGMVQLARLLPQRSSLCVRIVGDALPPAMLARLAAAADVTAAVRLCEAAENTHTLTPNQASAVYRALIPALPHPPGAGLDVEMADRRAQLTATLASLAQLRGPALADALGGPTARAEDAVASDPYGCHVEVELRPTEPVPDVAANLARDDTYDAEHMLVIRAVAFARTDDEMPAGAYRPQPGEDPASVNAQVVRLARRLFDACPEADLINAELWAPNRRPVHVLDHEQGVKNLRAGVLPRARRTARSVAFQAAVAEAVSAENWTTRLRSQAELARELVSRLQELPAHLRPIQNRRRRVEWAARVEQAAARIAALPGRPAERQAVLGTAQTTTLAHTAADLDEEMRAKDHARATLDLLAGVLVQVARGLDDHTALRGAGLRIAEVPEGLARAREQGAPHFAGVGDTLPGTLDTLASFHARLLTGLGQTELDRAFRSSIDMQELDRVLTSLAQKVSEHDRQVVLHRLSAAGVTAEAVISPDPGPIPPWQDQRAIVLVGLDDWVTVVATLQEWTETDRATDGISGKVIVLAVADRTMMPMGLHMFGAHGKVLPLPDDELADISTALALPLHTPDVGAALAQPSRQLIEFSYEQVRQVSRDPAWHPPPGRAIAPQRIADEVSARFAAVLADTDSQEVETSEDHAAVAARAMLALCEVVSAEDGRESGLAQQLADIDITALTTQEAGSAAYLFNLAHATALQADRMRTGDAIPDQPIDP
jgi:hypothetical protein